MMRGIKGNTKKTLAGGGPGESVQTPADVATPAMGFPAETDHVWTVKKRGKLPLYNKTRTLVIKSNIITMKKGEKVKMEIDLSTCVTPIFHDKACKITIKGKKTCQFQVERKQYQNLKAFVEMILQQDNTPSAAVKEKEPTSANTVRHLESNIQDVAEQEMSQLVKAESMEKKISTFQRLTDDNAYLESNIEFTLVLAEDDIISCELFWEIEDINKQSRQLSIKYIQDEKAVKPKDVASEPDEKVVKPEDVASEPDEKVVKPEDVASEPEEKAAKPEDVASEPDEKAVKPEDVAFIPDEKAVKPEDVASEPDEKAVKPEDVASEPDEKAVKPEDVAFKPDEKAVKPEDIAFIPDEKAVKPEDVTFEPDEKVVKPEDNAAESDAIVVKPEVVASESDEIVMKPEDVASELDEKAVKSEDVAFEPDGKAVKYEDVAFEPDEKAVKSEDVAFEPDEKAVKPEDVASELDEKAVKPEDVTFEPDEKVVKPEDNAAESDAIVVKPEVVTNPVHTTAKQVESVDKSVLNEELAVTATISKKEKRELKDNEKAETKGRQSVFSKDQANLRTFEGMISQKTNGKDKSLRKETSLIKKENIKVSKVPDGKVQRVNSIGSGADETAFTPQKNEKDLIDEATTGGGGETDPKGELILVRVGGDPTEELTSAGCEEDQKEKIILGDGGIRREESTSVEDRRELAVVSTVTHNTMCESDGCHSVKKKTKSFKKKITSAKFFVIKIIRAVQDSCKKTLKKAVEIWNKITVTSAKHIFENSSTTEVKCVEVEADVPTVVCKDKRPIEAPSSSITSCGNGKEYPMLKKAFFATTIYLLITPVSGDNFTAESSNSDWYIYLCVPAVIGYVIILLGEHHARLVLEFLTEQLGRFYINGGRRAVWVQVQHDGIHLAAQIVVLEPPNERFHLTAEEEQPPTANNQELVISN